MKKEKLFYGWVIVIASCLIMATTMGIILNCNSIFIKPISEDLGLSRQAVSTMISLISFGSMLTSFFSGRIFNEDNIVKVMRIAIFIMVISYFCNSLANSIWMLYVTHFINGICACLVTTLPITFIINNWFQDKVGLAFGFASMGSGIGGAIFNPIAGRILEQYGWRMAYRTLDFFILFIAVPCIFVLLKLRPSDKGLLPYTEGSKKEEIQEKKEEGYTFLEARHLPIFWILGIVAVILGVSMNGMYNSISPHLQDNGYTLQFSALFVSVSMMSIAISKIILGKLFDQFGVRVAFCFACLSLALSTTGLLLCKSFPALFLIVLFVGFGNVFGAVVFPLSIPYVFGKKEYRKIMGPYSALISMGGVIGPIVSGKIYDLFSSYNHFYQISIVVLLFVVIVMAFFLPNRKKQFQS